MGWGRARSLQLSLMNEVRSVRDLSFTSDLRVSMEKWGHLAGAWTPGFEPQPCHLPVVRPWPQCLVPESKAGC